MVYTTIERIGFKYIAIAATIFFLISFWLHYPRLVPTNYTDVVGIWHRSGVTEGLIPYVDYNLEYPVITGLAVYFSSIWGDLHTYYFIMNIMVFTSVLVSIYFVYRMLKKSNQPHDRINYFIIFTPTFIFFSIYSFDWIGISLLVLSIYFSYTQKAHLSGLFLGLSVAARIIPIVCLPFLLREFRSLREKMIFLIAAVSAWLAPNIYFMVVDFEGFLHPYAFQSTWGVEDSWIIIFGQFFPGRQNLSLVLLVSLLAFIYFWRRRFSVQEACLLALLAFVLTSYKFPPQYMILLLPFFALNKTNYSLFMTANILNVLIILFWFTPSFNLGSPLQITSPVQWVAIARQLVLLPILISFFLLRDASKEYNHNKIYSRSPIR
ncbi:MAG: hypothetical protein ACE5J2_07535 [Nitrososphaerales archaeon]